MSVVATLVKMVPPALMVSIHTSATAMQASPETTVKLVSPCLCNLSVYLYILNLIDYRTWDSSSPVVIRRAWWSRGEDI